MLQHHQVIIVGAGPGGISVAAALRAAGLEDLVILEKGSIGQAWLDYPTETHLLSESAADHDDNMIAGVSTSEVFPHMPHPSHVIYQKYLEHVIQQKKIKVLQNVQIQKVTYNPQDKQFILVTPDENYFTANYLVWAAGMYSSPNETLDSAECYIHYARMPYLNDIQAKEITVVGSANGASGVILQLARPGRVVTLVSAHEYVVPEPIDCLWKEQMRFVKELEMQGLVKIVDNFRVARIFKQDDQYILESELGHQLVTSLRPIVCTGFLPNIEPIKSLIDQREEGHDLIVDMDEHHQAKKTAHLYLAGVAGKTCGDEGMIIEFREFGEVIAKDIQRKLNLQ